MKNQKVRIAMIENNVKQYEVAKLLGISETSLCRKLREELPEEEQQKMISIIKGEPMKEVKQKNFELGDRIRCRSWRELKSMALTLSSEGYGVTVIGFGDMSDNVLTITALPEGSEND